MDLIYNKKRRVGEYILAIPVPSPQQQRFTPQQPPPVQQIESEKTFLFQTAKTPQELVYTIMLDQRATFSKSELLQVVEKLINLFEEDQFKGECPYIG